MRSLTQRAWQKTISLASSAAIWFGMNLAATIALLYIQFSSLMTQHAWWPDAYAVASNVLLGCLVSFVFYYLLVYRPERRRKLMLKNNASATYLSLKREILFHILTASVKGGRSDISIDSELIDELMIPANFRRMFEGGQEADEGFYAFENQMSSETFEFIEIVGNLRLLARQLNFLLHNFIFDDEVLLGYFTRLEMLLLRIQASGAGYDESEPLCSFVFQIYAGWHWVDGYVGYDRIKKSLDSL